MLMRSAVKKMKQSMGVLTKVMVWVNTWMDTTVTLEDCWRQRKKQMQKACLTCFGKGRVTKEEDGWSWGQGSGGGGADHTGGFYKLVYEFCLFF